jgi:hypothetical protein
MDRGVTIDAVVANNHKRAFEVTTAAGSWDMPYWALPVRPDPGNPVAAVEVDEELARMGFRYLLADGSEDSVPLDSVLDFNRDPDYLRDILLFQLTARALKELETAPMSRRELIRRLGTSPSQFYRLIDTTNYRKSLDQMVRLLQVLGCEVEVSVTARSRLDSVS